MPCKNYLKGVKKERALVNEARANGNISFRSAGSHSPIDVIIIDKIEHRIRLIQCKPYDYRGKDALQRQYSDLNGSFDVSFEVL